MPTSLVLLGALLILAGSFLPWVKVTAPFIGSVSKSGTDGVGDGWLFVGLALAAVATGLSMRSAVRGSAAAWLVGLLACIGAVAEGLWISHRFNSDSALVATSLGPGVFVIFGGGLAILFGAYRREQQG